MASPLSALVAKRAPLETRSWLRQVGRAGPEVWVWPVAAACWLVLGWAALGWYPLGMTSGFGHHLGMAHSAEPSVAVVLAEHFALWTAMVGATMGVVGMIQASKGESCASIAWMSFARARIMST